MTEPRSVGMEIKTVSNLFRRKMEENCQLSDQDSCTGVQAMLLNYLARHADGESVYQRDIERVFSIRRSSVTGVLQIMEKNGLLDRSGDPSDARLKRLTLTPKGRALYVKVKGDIHAMEAKAVRGLTAAEIDQFFATMGKIRRNLEE